MLNQLSVKTDEIYKMFVPREGFNTVYYGKIGNGKTRNATADIIELVARGEIVYANWKIELDDFDQTKSLKVAWAKFLGGQKYFYNFKKENFHFFEPDNIDLEFLSRLVNVHLFIDEGQWILNSMDKYDPNDKLSVAKLRLVLHGRHHCRSLNVITQRPSNINKNVRSQVSIWYRCVKRLDWFGIMIFQRWAIQDMKDDLPVEFITKHDKDGKVIRDVPNGDLKTYWVNVRNDKIFPSYNTHAMRSSDAILPVTQFDVFESNRKTRFYLLLSLMFPKAWAFIGQAFGWIKKRFNKGRSITKGIFLIAKDDVIPKIEKSQYFKQFEDIKRRKGG